MSTAYLMLAVFSTNQKIKIYILNLDVCKDKIFRDVPSSIISCNLTVYVPINNPRLVMDVSIYNARR